MVYFPVPEFNNSILSTCNLPYSSKDVANIPLIIYFYDSPPISMRLKGDHSVNQYTVDIINVALYLYIPIVEWSPDLWSVLCLAF